jgi:hypothetical protein
VVGVKFLADHTAFVETAGATNGVGQFHRAAMGAKTDGRNGGFPLGTTMALLGMAYTLLGNWHNGTPLNLVYKAINRYPVCHSRWKHLWDKDRRIKIAFHFDKKVNRAQEVNWKSIK